MKTSARNGIFPAIDARGLAGRVFSGPQLLQIAMPMGGLGAGCISLSGHGSLQDFSLRHRPATSAVADGHGTQESGFALLRVKGAQPVTRLVEGPLPAEKIYDQGLQAQGYRHGGYEGLPRFERCRFTGAYPFGQVSLSDRHVPLKVSITGFSPLIPRDDRNSGIPAAILEYTLTNPTRRTVAFEFSYHLSHLAVGKSGRKSARSRAVPDLGVFSWNVEKSHDASFGSAALAVIGHKPRVKGAWFRGGWFDWISVLWREASTGRFTANDGNPDREENVHHGGSVLVPGRLSPGQSVTIPCVIAWHFPNVDQTYGMAPACGCGAGGNCAPDDNPPPLWQPYYATQWSDALDVARYVREHYASLRERTLAFRKALARSTVPPEVLDAVSANLAILKSPTILRQANGNVWAWEGCCIAAGCCFGSCTHVWNYAQALPHLFPQLERTLREQELERSMDAEGHINFRAALPDGPTPHHGHPAADGQLGGIMKVFRDWQISGDRAWLERMYPSVKRSLDYCIRRWDPDRRGGLFEPHHNTYDIEFWGPDGMCTSIYAGALAAMAVMAAELGREDDARSYRAQAETSARFLDAELFNGSYFEQKVMWKELRDQSFAQKIAAADDGTDEVLRLLRAEGPKYQYGRGCLADGVIGAWMARLYGIDSPQTVANVRKHLRALFRHNFKTDLFEHACAQRPGYAVGHEPGLLLCTWPRGGKPTLPFVYSDEVWTGIEYQVASHMILEGLVEEGLALVRAVRSRYEGHVRNPFNEYECGSYYARAMASYALLPSLSGFRYSAASRTLWLAPRLEKRPFRTFFSTAGGYGVLTLKKTSLTIEMVEGELKVRALRLTRNGKERKIACDATASAGENPLTLKL
ncbi:MAG TPA: GH116 family glycosyl hydrolase [Phycisphaerae bacterium]|nr:GH116 family glycosyl hydrolase [Phycisphaerae bacterium]